MKADQILVINPGEVDRLLPLEKAIEAVEAAFRAHATGEAALFPVVRERLREGAVSGIKSGYWPNRHIVGLKLAGYWPGNRSAGLPNHQASVLLADSDSGRLLALMDGNVITSRRTAAASVIGARLLARPKPRVIAILGCGAQGRSQAHALITSFRSLSEVHVWDRSPARAESLAADLRAVFPIEVSTATTGADAIHGAQLINTTTASTSPLFELEDVAAGAHINAMGSDTAGKRELGARLVESTLLVVDDRDQSRRLGESQPPVSLETEPPTVGEILLGLKPARTSEDQVTVFDSTGIGLQDLAAAEAIYRSAIRMRVGTSVPWTFSMGGGQVGQFD